MKKLTGITEIQLRDAKTGIITERIKSQNTVTLGVQNLFNGGLNKLVKSYQNTARGLEGLYKVSTSIAETFFGGVLIFSEPISTTEGHVIPSVEEMKTFIGCGNLGTGITDNTFKGVFNSNESELPSSTGNAKFAKFVWDFTTGQANGRIASICLTSDCGGSLGFKINGTPDNTDIQYMRGFSSAQIFQKNVDSNIITSQYPLFSLTNRLNSASKFYIDNGFIVEVYQNTARIRNASNEITNNQKGLYLGDSFNPSSVSTYTDVTLTKTHLTNNFVKSIDNKLYCADSSQPSGYLRLNLISGSTATESVVDIDLANIMVMFSNLFSDYSITESGARDILKNGVIYDENLYFLLGVLNPSDTTAHPERLYLFKIALDGLSPESSYEIPAANLTEMKGRLVGTNAFYPGSLKEFDFVEAFGELFLGSNVLSNAPYQKCYYLVNTTGNLGIEQYPMFATPNVTFNSAGIKKIYIDEWNLEPFVNYDMIGVNYLPTKIWTPYLATVNNISEVLIKDATKTMKIIYTLQNN